MKKFLLACLVLVSFALFIVSGCSTTGGTDSGTTTTTASGATTTTTSGGTTTTTAAGSHVMVGTWAGTWTDLVYSVSGTMSATFTQSGSTLIGTGSIDLTEVGFGLGIETGTAEGTIVSNTVVFNFGAPTVGSGSGTITTDLVAGAGTVGGAASFGPFTFTGTIDPSGNTITGNFIFTSPTGGTGEATVTRQ